MDASSFTIQHDQNRTFRAAFGRLGNTRHTTLNCHKNGCLLNTYVDRITSSICRIRAIIDAECFRCITAAPKCVEELEDFEELENAKCEYNEKNAKNEKNE